MAGGSQSIAANSLASPPAASSQSESESEGSERVPVSERAPEEWPIRVVQPAGVHVHGDVEMGGLCDEPAEPDSARMLLLPAVAAESWSSAWRACLGTAAAGPAAQAQAQAQAEEEEAPSTPLILPVLERGSGSAANRQQGSRLATGRVGTLLLRALMGVLAVAAVSMAAVAGAAYADTSPPGRPVTPKEGCTCFQKEEWEGELRTWCTDGTTKYETKSWTTKYEKKSWTWPASCPAVQVLMRKPYLKAYNLDNCSCWDAGRFVKSRRWCKVGLSTLIWAVDDEHPACPGFHPAGPASNATLPNATAHQRLPWQW